MKFPSSNHMWSIKCPRWICLIDFYVGIHSKRKADDKNSQSKSAKKTANFQSLLQCVMDVKRSCASSLGPVGWWSDFLELCHPPWQLGILEFQNQNWKWASFDYCFRSLWSLTNGNWFMCVGIISVHVYVYTHTCVYMALCLVWFCVIPPRYAMEQKW